MKIGGKLHMYSIITFPAIKVVDFKGRFIESSDVVTKFYGKIGGVLLAFNAFGKIGEMITSYNLKPNDSLTITAEIMLYKNRSGKIDESYKVLTAIPVPGTEKAVWPTVYFPGLRVTSLKDGEAKTGKYYRIMAKELTSMQGEFQSRSLVAWSNGMAEVVEKLRLKEGSRISAVAQGRFLIGPEGKRIEYTLLSFEYLSNRYDKATKDVKETETVESEAQVIDEKPFEPIEESVSVKAAPKKNATVEFDINEFESLFT